MSKQGEEAMKGKYVHIDNHWINPDQVCDIFDAPDGIKESSRKTVIVLANGEARVHVPVDEVVRMLEG